MVLVELNVFGYEKIRFGSTGLGPYYGKIRTTID